MLLAVLGLAGALLVVWSFAIGPVSVWRVLSHGTTTVWDHLEYPVNDIKPADTNDPWFVSVDPVTPPDVTVDGRPVSLVSVLGENRSLAFIVVNDGSLVYEWYADGHGVGTPSMVFSVTKSILSLLIGAAIDDGLIGSAADPVTEWVPELADRGFEEVTIEDLLRMDSNMDYVEGDNPFGLHVKFNYTPNLTDSILDLQVREVPDSEFRYKSGDNALLGLILDRALGEETVTSYMAERLMVPIGAEHPAAWITDREDGLERTWCCLAVAPRDLARIGQLILNDGQWNGRQVVSEDWLSASFEPGYHGDRWPADYAETQLENYGYQWWLTEDARVALGKGGQYLYVDPERDVVIVRFGEERGDVGWLDIISQVARDLG